YASNSKFSLLGAMRAVAQIVSYEVPVGLCILAVVIVSQSLDLREVANQQSAAIPATLFGIKGLEIQGAGLLHWNVFRMPLLLVGFIIFYIATLAECNRAPFDIPEAESELIGGFHTEYSGFRFAIFFLAEYGMMLFVSVLAVLLFLGGWNSPLPNVGDLKLYNWSMGREGTVFGNFCAFFWLYGKTLVLMFVQVWVRWTFPRVRVDQLMYLCWKVFIPFSLLLVLACSVWKVWMI
ncbi:MAG: NADH-quinone oxidoreductase subunit H, partial [Cytophagales bacterium]|nr:NADH-quinone oxidoreductase subunit H [Cytophagales bacterium]